MCVCVCVCLPACLLVVIMYCLLFTGRPQKGTGHARPNSSPPPQWFGEDEIEFKPQDIPFTAAAGPLGAAAALKSDKPEDFFQLFLSDDLLQHIADQMNLYAEQYLQTVESDQASSRLGAWKPVTLEELKTFLGLLFLMDVIVKPELRLYWPTDEVITTSYFGKTMAGNRFQLILRFLHFRDNTEATDGRDRLID